MTIQMTSSARCAVEPITSVSIAEAKSHLSEIVARVEAGEDVVITKRGVEVVRMTAITAKKDKKINWEAIRAFRKSLPVSDISGAELIRQMRDEERY